METYQILQTLLFTITTQRFGGVGALEGREKVPDHISLPIEKKMFLAENYGINRIFRKTYPIFPQNLSKRGA